jgi:hypothetical protein
MNMRDIMALFEADEFDYGFDEVDASDAHVKPFAFLNSLQQKVLDKHKARQDKIVYRDKQRKRFDKEAKMIDADGYDAPATRHIPKSQVGYKPFKIPLIRFGKFKSRSRIGLDAEFRAEMGGGTHEVGVSCYEGYPMANGCYELMEPRGGAVWDSSGNQFCVAESYVKSLINYLDHGIPMDIFLIHGHLCSFGKELEWLDVGSDGEYLLDASKPYKQVTISPEKIFVGRLNYVDAMNKKYNLDRVRARIGTGE